MQLQFLAPVEIYIFNRAVERLQFLTQVELYFFKDIQFSRAWFVVSALFIKKGTFNHCGRSKGSEQYTSWKVRVPDCVFS